jgi:hypothetical protein
MGEEKIRLVQCCGTGTFCLFGTGTGLHAGSGLGSRSEKRNKKVKISNRR